LFVFVIRRSETRPTASASDAELFDVSGSVVPAGAVTVAVFDNVPDAVCDSVPDAVNVALPPDRRVTVPVFADPELTVATQEDPAVGTHDQDRPDSVLGNVSATAAFVTLLGPLFVTTIEYDTVDPGAAEALPSDFVIVRSEMRAIVTVLVAVLLAATRSITPPGAAMLAVLVSVPVALWLSEPLSVNVTLAPASILTSAFRLPLPLAAGQVAFGEATHVQPTPESAAGIVSSTVAPVTLSGPLFAATTV